MAYQLAKLFLYCYIQYSASDQASINYYDVIIIIVKCCTGYGSHRQWNQGGTGVVCPHKVSNEGQCPHKNLPVVRREERFACPVV